MNGTTKRVIIGTSSVVLSALILWLASHALRAEAFMAVVPVQVQNQQKQLDRIEYKMDQLIRFELEKNIEE
jgi:hypothetical protein